MLRFEILEFMPLGENQVAIRRGAHAIPEVILLTSMRKIGYALADRLDVKHLAYKDITDEHLYLRHMQSLSVSEYRDFINQLHPTLEPNEICTLLFFKIRKYC